MRKSALYIIGITALIFLIASCASIGNPSGGPRDEDPPRFLFASPANGSVEVTPGKAVLTFNEIVNVKDAFSKVVVSPPGASTPRVSSLGRRVTVEFRDTLLPNTTYTVDFGDAIVDNNEGNKLENFIYTFSTGPVLDTLMVSGMVLDAIDLSPAKGMYVGLHTNLADSAFRKTRFDRIAKTDDNGKFVIGGLAPGSYRIYALEDKDGDLAWSSPEESLAFYDAIIEPSMEYITATDTIINLKTGEVDTIVSRERVRFLPNNILLRSFNTGYRQQYITKYERTDSTRLDLIFNAPADSLPVVSVITPAGSVFPIEEIAVTERSATNDTLSFWLKNPEIIRSDTLRLALTYLRADSVYNMVAVSDTLRMLTNRPPVKQSKVEKKDKGEAADTLPPPIPTLELKTVNGKPEVNSAFIFEFPQPVEAFDLSMVRLKVKQDSLYMPAPGFETAMILTDTLNPRRVKIDYPWQYDTSYVVEVDSLAARGIYGLFTDDFSTEFKIRPESEYGSLTFNLFNMGADSIPRFVELLNSSGKPIRSLPVVNGKVTFEYLLAGKYTARVVEDFNGNGLWDPGNFDLGQLPDVSYYYPRSVELKQNWSQELDWNVFSTAVDLMLPEELRKKSR